MGFDFFSKKGSRADSEQPQDDTDAFDFEDTMRSSNGTIFDFEGTSAGSRTESVPSDTAFGGIISTMTDSSAPLIEQNKHVAVKIRVITCRPRDFSEVQKLAPLYRDGTSVILNFEGTPKAHMYRILDFFAGMAFICDGKMQRVGSEVFWVTHQGIEITSDVFTEKSHDE